MKNTKQVVSAKERQARNKKYSNVLSPKKYLTPEEEGSLRATLDKYMKQDIRNTTFILLMLEMGFRPEELTQLTWADVNLVDGSIFIETAKRGVDRCLPMKKSMLIRMKMWKNETSHGQPTDYVFQIKPRRMRDIWYQYRPAKKVFYCLRHTFAINMYKNSNYDLRLTQQGLGHKYLANTEKYLQVHASLDDFRKAIGD